MNLLQKTKDLCRLYGIKPARSKGQNFLVSEEFYDKIISSSELSKKDTVLEIGPGLGFLTARLAKVAGQVVAVELDDRLASFLRDASTDNNIDNIKIINEDILKLDLKKIQNLKFKIVANLPYNITSIFLRKFLSENEIKPELMVLMLQKEVAERICAKPGKMSLLSVSVQFYAKPEIVAYVTKNNFWPSPEVDSAIIRIKTKDCFLCHSGPGAGIQFEEANIISGSRVAARDDNKKTNVINEKRFFQLVKFGFSAKRKMLKNNLAGGFRIAPKEAQEALVKAGLGPMARAEDLSVDDWLEVLNFTPKL